MKTIHIHIRGQVQGVGFRPFVYNLAQRMALTGWVNNTTDGVHVEASGPEEALEVFARALRTEAPPLSRITRMEIQDLPYQEFVHFEIIHDDGGRPADLLLSPDFALCPECRAEMLDPANRRFGYPFITCTLCGPRYSISHALPYDRERTVMDVFPQCPECQTEYNDPTNRRYYSQTNSCPNCGIRLSLHDVTGTIIETQTDRCLEKLAAALRAGKIAAIKGIGGYLLLTDATNAEVVARLRARKHRPSKPFAVLYPNLAALEKDALASETAKAALNSPEAPIVLLPLKDHPGSGIAASAIAPGLRQVGAMLPYAPLLEMLMQVFPVPVVATSGNISNAPIVYQDEQAFSELSPVADFFLAHNRPILIPQDDSVLRFTPKHGQKIWVRRSRGLAPTLLLEAFRSRTGSALAMGADMKSAFALLHAGNTYLSQYLGDLDSWQTQEHFRKVLQHLTGLFQARPEEILADMHPGYFSHQLAKTMAEESGLPFRLFQHHEAHFAAVLAEHHLLASETPVLGVIFDGTGLGHDRQVWGGEFFLWENRHIHRSGHLEYFPHLAGDKMAREPRLAALAMTHALPEAMALAQSWFSDTEWNIYQQLLDRGVPLQSSSMGRVFDAVAALCGLSLRSSFEGEAAMLLEEAARHWQELHAGEMQDSYICHWQENRLSVSSLMKQVLTDVQAGKPAGYIASRFHGWVARAVEEMALSFNVKALAFSGGVFQNAVLVDRIIDRLQSRFLLYFHEQLSPNDENIAIGQLALAGVVQ